MDRQIFTFYIKNIPEPGRFYANELALKPGDTPTSTRLTRNIYHELSDNLYLGIVHIPRNMGQVIGRTAESISQGWDK